MEGIALGVAVDGRQLHMRLVQELDLLYLLLLQAVLNPGDQDQLLLDVLGGSFHHDSNDNKNIN